MQNKYMNLNAAPAPQMGAAPQFNQHQFMQAHMQTLAAVKGKSAPAPPKKDGVKDKVKKYWPLIAVAGFAGYQVAKAEKDKPAPPAPKA